MPGGVYIPPGSVAALDPSYYVNGSNPNISETIPRKGMNTAATVAIGATGVMTSWAIDLRAGQVVTNVSFRSGTTAAVTPTNWWVALYDTAATPNLLRQSADQTTTAVGTNTNFTIPLASSYTVVTTGTHYVAICFAAATVPTLNGIAGNASLNAGIVAGTKATAQTSGTGLTSTAPATIASPTTITGICYLVVS